MRKQCLWLQVHLQNLWLRVHLYDLWFKLRNWQRKKDLKIERDFVIFLFEIEIFHVILKIRKIEIDSLNFIFFAFVFFEFYFYLVCFSFFVQLCLCFFLYLISCYYAIVFFLIFIFLFVFKFALRIDDLFHCMSQFQMFNEIITFAKYFFRCCNLLYFKNMIKDSNNINCNK